MSTGSRTNVDIIRSEKPVLKNRTTSLAPQPPVSATNLSEIEQSLPKVESFCNTTFDEKLGLLYFGFRTSTFNLCFLC